MTRPDISSLDTAFRHTHEDCGLDIKFEDMDIPRGECVILTDVIYYPNVI